MRTYLLMMIISILSLQLKAQDTLIGWTFPTGTSADAIADKGLQANSTYSISTTGGTNAIDFSKNGFTTKAAQSTGWDTGKDLKAWQISFTTVGFKDIQIWSKQTSGGNNPGPRDFKIQYSLDHANWTDVTPEEIEVLNDWTSGVLNGLSLSTNCEDEQTLYVRWIMTSDTASDGSMVVTNGISKMDDIYVTATKIPNSFHEQTKTKFSFYPNPVQNTLYLENVETISVFGLDGKQILYFELIQHMNSLDLSALNPGIYLLRIQTFEGQIWIQKLSKN